MNIFFLSYRRSEQLLKQNAMFGYATFINFLFFFLLTFQVQNMRSDLTYRFSIVNFSKPDSLYNYGMKPVLYSQIEAERHFVGWSRVGSNIR